MSVCICLRLIRQACFVWVGIIFMVIGNMLQRPVYAGETSGSVELGLQETVNSTSGNEEVKTVTRSQRYSLDYDDYLYRPWLADYRIGGTWSEVDSEKSSEETETKLTSYRFNGKLFPYSPFPLTMYVIENSTDVSINSSADSSIDSRLYGADLKLDFYSLPTTNLFYYGQTTNSTLSSIKSEQDSETKGINMFKRWGGLTGNLRYENSDYSETYTKQTATADRVTGSLVYRPSDTLQASMIYSDYQRESDNVDTVNVDPLYSDRDSRSHNLSLLWNPQERLNLSVYANYFLEDYELNRREAKDSRVNVDFRLTDHMSAFASNYNLQTNLNGEEYNSKDDRSGLAYSRTALFGSLELQGRLSGGYFSRTTESKNEVQNQDGHFYQTGGRIGFGISAGRVRFSPYYDISVGRNQQTNIHATRTMQQDTGVRVDGVVAGGRLNGSVSYTELEQENEMIIYSEQFRSYISYEHRVMRRAMVRVQAGKSYTKGHVENNTYETFIENNDTEVQTSYSRVDYSTPVYGTDILCNTSYRKENRTTRSGVNENNELFDVRFTHQFGKLFTEAGFMKKQTEINGVDSKDTILFATIRRDFSFGSK